MVLGQGRGGGQSILQAVVYMVYTLQTDVEFTFNYQMIFHNPYRHVLMSDSV